MLRDRYIILFSTLIVLGVLIHTIAYYSSIKTIDITVVDKERIMVKNGDQMKSKYLIFTEEEVFQNQDDVLLGKWNSSDIQGKLRIGNSYKVKVIGWRVPFFSTYRNIIKIYKHNVNTTNHEQYTTKATSTNY